MAELFANDLEFTAAGCWFVISSLAVLGGVFGSFMNVVIYRMPLRLSLSHPGSRCPQCEHPIRWYDNVPIFGWIFLRGRCRDCGTRISPRYPAVELLMATIAALLAWKQCHLQGIADNGPIESFYKVDLPTVVYHLLLSCTLVCAALIEFDGHLPPRRLLIPAFIVGIAAPYWWTHLRYSGNLVHVPGLPEVQAIADAFAGIFAAMLLGVVPWIAWFTNAEQSKLKRASAKVAELMLVGAFLGDHAVVAIGVESMALYFLVEQLARMWPALGRIGWAGSLTSVSLAWMLSWPESLLLDPEFLGRGPMRFLIGGTIMAVLAIALLIVPPPERQIRGS